MGALLAAWAALAAWQYHEYANECELGEQVLRRQAESVMNALIGGIRSHRRLGRFFPEQLQIVLDDLAASQNVLAVAVFSSDGRLALKAGVAKDCLDLSALEQSGESWDECGFRRISEFYLEPDADRRPGEPGGAGLGRGWGRQTRWKSETPETFSPLAAGGRFKAALVLDRSMTDDLRGRAFWLRAWVVVAGGLVLLLVGLSWWATVRLVQARAHALVLEAETRYLRNLSQAAAGLAHETRNPLGLIRGWAQRLAECNSQSPEHLQHVQTVVEECDRVAARINQFLAYAKPCQPEPKPVALDEIVQELNILLEPDLDAKQLSLRSTVARVGCTIQADREMLRQALFNLIQNAIQFAPEGGQIELSAHSHNGFCRIEIADRGPGVPAENSGLLFTPYFTTRASGTGLGLAIVQRIAAAHGWQVGYTPRPGGGAIFWLDRIHA